MDKILDQGKLSAYFQEALNNPAFIKDLTEYQQVKILDLCEDVILKNSYRLAEAIVMNKDNPKIEHNAKMLRNAFLGKHLRLRAALYEALGIKGQDEEEPAKAGASKASFSSYLNWNISEEKMNEVLEMGKGLSASKISSFLYALDAEGILKPSFIELKLGLQDEMLREQFSFNQKKQGLGQQMKECKEDNPKRLEEIKHFRTRIQAIKKQ